MQEWVNALMYGGALAATVLFIWGLMTRKWMMYTDHLNAMKGKDEVIQIKNEQIAELKQVAKENLQMAREAMGLAEKVT